MTVTTTYSLTFTDLFTPFENSVAYSLASLSNDRLGVIYRDPDNSGDRSIGRLFDYATSSEVNIASFAGTNGSLVQLANGSLVVAGQDADSVIFQIFNGTTGATLVNSTDLGDANTRNADVAALTGGRFVIVCEDELDAPGGDADIDVLIRNADGSAVASFTLAATGDRDSHARVAALDNGNFAVTWQRETGGETEVWYAIYDAAGGVVMAPVIADTAGTTNDLPDITAMNGGFAIIYRGSGSNTPSAYPLLTFNSAGTPMGSQLIGTSNLEAPGITRLSNGMLAVTTSIFDPVDGYFSWVGILDQTGSTLLMDERGPLLQGDLIAGYFGGMIAIGGPVEQFGMLAASRLSVSDEAGDTIVGDDLPDTMQGNGGNDVLIGMGGNDSLDGGTGVSVLDGGAGNDQLFIHAGAEGSSITGGTGTDQFTVLSTLAATVSVDGTLSSLASLSGIEALILQPGASLTLTGTQFLTGLASNVGVQGGGNLIVNMVAGQYFLATSTTFITSTLTVNGTTGVDVIKGPLTAATTANGGDGGDQIRTGNLVDTIDGGAGNDKIMGLGGADLLTGGAGADQFRYLFTTDSGLGTGADRILDFTNGEDKLDFRVLDANPALAGRQALTFIGNAAFGATGTAQLRYGDSGADTVVQIDLDGNGTADMEIVLAGHAGQALSGTDFLL